MQGVGPPLVTPFDEEGNVDEMSLRDLIAWVEDRGIDFLVACGSNGEAELMTAEERARIIEIVATEASVPVLAGTGNPGLHETLEATEAATAAGADAALVVTPFYYHHDQAALKTYYQEVADAADIPVYLYSVPAYTNVRIEPETVSQLAEHPNIAGMKDSSGNIGEFVRIVRRVKNEEFDAMIGSGNVLAQALNVGASGGILALANIAPKATKKVYETHQEDSEHACELNVELVELNHAVTATYGVAGLKWAMRARDAPAGHVRPPHRPVDMHARDHLESLIASL